MNELVVYCIDPKELEFYASLPCHCQVLFATNQTSRHGIFDISQAQLFAKTAKQLGLSAVLLWDTLMTENQLNKTCASLKESVISSFDAIRVLDLGAAFWLHNKFGHKPLQLIVENSNLNLTALENWCQFFSPQLEKLVLGNQLGIQTLSKYCQSLPVKIELLGAGPLLAFSSPRKLLSPLLKNQAKASLYAALADSLEAKNIQLKATESEFGTNVYLHDDLFILNHIEKLGAMGIHSLRIDLKNEATLEERLSSLKPIANALTTKNNLTGAIWPNNWSSYFFEKGLAAEDYSELKSKRQLLNRDDCLAEIIAVQSGISIAFYSQKSFVVPENYSIIWPNGERLDGVNLELSDMKGTLPKVVSANSLLTTFNWIRGACPGACLF